jgi:hypothetical protein
MDLAPEHRRACGEPEEIPPLDRITLGRTNMRFGRFGKNIPGDLLVRAEVVR